MKEINCTEDRVCYMDLENNKMVTENVPEDLYNLGEIRSAHASTPKKRRRSTQKGIKGNKRTKRSSFKNTLGGVRRKRKRPVIKKKRVLKRTKKRSIVRKRRRN